MAKLFFDALAFESKQAEQTEVVERNNYTIKDASKEIKFAIKIKATSNKSCFPFDSLEIGKAFDVPVSEVNEKAFRVLCCLNGKRTGKKFKCKKFKDSGLFEVARVA